MFKNYDEWKLYDGIGIEKPVQICEKCGTELYKGEQAMFHDGDYYCDESCLLERITHEEVIL